MIIVIYQFYLLNCTTSESFSNAEQSIGGVDDQNSINTLAQLARKLMEGGAKVPGNLTADKLTLGTKFLMSGIGDGMANDDWLRMVNPADPTKYAGGFAAGKLWTADNTINGRNLFAEIDAIKARLGNLSGVRIGRWSLNDEGVAFTIRDTACGGDCRWALFNGHSGNV